MFERMHVFFGVHIFLGVSQPCSSSPLIVTASGIYPATFGADTRVVDNEKDLKSFQAFLQKALFRCTLGEACSFQWLPLAARAKKQRHAVRVLLNSDLKNSDGTLA